MTDLRNNIYRCYYETSMWPLETFLREKCAKQCSNLSGDHVISNEDEVKTLMRPDTQRALNAL